LSRVIATRCSGQLEARLRSAAIQYVSNCGQATKERSA
jgi:hypothetical protein